MPGAPATLSEQLTPSTPSLGYGLDSTSHVGLGGGGLAVCCRVHYLAALPFVEFGSCGQPHACGMRGWNASFLTTPSPCTSTLHTCAR
mmetsp:Transcript_82976/g.165657  ORF Transcript_82976/g.165657 Transcript_82976/m.165657 type:complete len:88 (+) Transcript_82976:843-1106(+)